MKTMTGLLAAGLSLITILALADTAASKTTLKFTSIPIEEKIGAPSHNIFPYRSEDRVIVVVVDPIQCGQKPNNPSFEIRGAKLVLHYDLTAAPAGAPKHACTAHSTFDLENVPHGDLQVEFSGGKEPVQTAQMKRCPKTEPVVDVWDCMVPLK
jgi:hypothetical protein